MRFDYLKPAQGPVVDGLEDHEKIYALEQAEYLPLRTLPAQGGVSSIYRCELTAEQRQMVVDGADVLVEILHFGGPLAPSRVMLINQQNFRPEESKTVMAQWFRSQTCGPYEISQQEPDEADLRTTPCPVEAQFAALSARYLNAKLSPVGDGSFVVTIPRFVIPIGWTPPETTLYFVVPVGYPVARPDSFWTDDNVRLDGGFLPQTTGLLNLQPLIPEGARWWSWHLSTWSPNNDTLMTWVNTIQRRFEERR